eukprot:scaffold20330_cov46-Phaeocystis_antarctica.AAC.2
MAGHRLSGLVDAVRSQRFRGGGGVIRRVVLIVRRSDVPLAAGGAGGAGATLCARAALHGTALFGW